MYYPISVEIDGEVFEINTDFRIAIECNKVAEDKTIGDIERALAIIYLLFGDKGLEANDKHGALLKKAKKFLSCNKEVIDIDEEPDMDYIEDYAYIKTSFRSDYGINLDKEKMHWWEFYDLINGLSNSEFGNCCILNRIRNLRNYNPAEIKDDREREKIIKAQERVQLKKNKKQLTESQEKSLKEFNELIGL